MKKFKKKLLIDLDGVLNEYNGNYDENHIPPIKNGAEEFLRTLHTDNEFELYLFTTRNLLLSAKWLFENKIDKYFKEITNVKSAAYLIVDDRTVCHNGNFKATVQQIQSFKAWWKTK